MKLLAPAAVAVLLISLLLGVASAWPINGAASAGIAAARVLLLFGALYAFGLFLPRRMNLPMQIFVAMVVGIAAGWALRRWGDIWFVSDYLGIFGALFILLLKLVVVPLIFVSIVAGVAGIGDPRKLGSVGAKALGYYLGTTCLAVLIGLVCVNLIRPGAGGQAVVERVRQAEAAAEVASPEGVASLGRLIKDEVLPAVIQNPIMSDQNPLVIIFFAIVLGTALAALGAAAKPALDVFGALDKAFITIVLWIMKLAPIGVFALMAEAIADLGIDYIVSLALYVFTVVLGLGLHFVVLVFGISALVGGVSPIRFLRGMAPALQLSFTTSSSSATLPVTIECMTKRVGADANVSNFMLPIGATVNMDGTALYQAVAVLFISQVLGLELTAIQQCYVFGTAILVSIGTAGIPGGSIALMPIVLGAVGIDAVHIGIVIGVDRFLDMCRTIVNITGDSVGAVVVSRLEGLMGEPRQIV